MAVRSEVRSGGLPEAVVALLDTVVPVARRAVFLRHVLDAAPPVAPGGAWHQPLAGVSLGRLLATLRADYPAALARIDGVAARVVPVAERVGRCVAEAPVHLCLVGRQAFVEQLLAHPVLERGGHLHLVGPPGAGRSLVLAQVARRLADVCPVVVWVDGRTPEGVRSALAALGGELGLPPAPMAVRAAQVAEWLAGNPDWAALVDDAPEALPTALAAGAGRVLTVGVAPRPDADAQVALPELTPEARALIVRRWSRGRAQLDAAFVSEAPVAALAVVSAAAARSGPGRSTVAAALEALSEDALALDGLLRAYGPAPIPAPLYLWPPGRPVGAAVPRALVPVLRSERVARAAATELVRGGWAHWVGDALLRGRVGGEVDRSWAPDQAAELVAQALRDADDLPLAWRPHVAWLADDPRVQPSLRRAIATRAGRLVLSAGDADDAVAWFQRALAACGGDPSTRIEIEAGLLNDLGVAWRRAGRLDDAEAVLRDALARDEQAAEAHPLSLAATRANLGHVLREQGHHAAARALYLAAHSVRRAELGPDHPDTAAVGIQLGVAAWQLGDLGEARLAWTEAVHSLSRARPPQRVLLASALRHLARLEASGGDLSLAVRCADRAHGLLMVEHDDITHPEVAALRLEISDYDRRLDSASDSRPA